ncbi:MAG: fasciclin domain-containing protein [Acidimicrobiia bacterium]|nr:fasciclin domain-containing protein [Acidimicrobiia bacterium]
MKRISVRLAVVVASVALTAAACGSSNSDSDTMPAKESTTSTAPASANKTIVVVASSNPDFSTLVDTVKAAGLVETLSGPGPFTVFAPTNAAFDAIPDDQLKEILADEGALKRILTYHVVPGVVMASDLQPTQMVKTVEGQDLDIKVTNGVATVNGCQIVKTDIEASNGVIHVIDCVLLPPAV